MDWIELANALLADSTWLRRSLLSSDCAPEMSLRSFLIASRLCVTASVVTVAGVRAFRSSTCLVMSSRASQTLLWAFSSEDSPHAPTTSASATAATTQIAIRIPSTLSLAADRRCASCDRGDSRWRGTGATRGACPHRAAPSVECCAEAGPIAGREAGGCGGGRKRARGEGLPASLVPVHLGQLDPWPIASRGGRMAPGQRQVGCRRGADALDARRWRCLPGALHAPEARGDRRIEHADGATLGFIAAAARDASDPASDGGGLDPAEHARCPRPSRGQHVPHHRFDERIDPIAPSGIGNDSGSRRTSSGTGCQTGRSGSAARSSDTASTSAWPARRNSSTSPVPSSRLADSLTAAAQVPATTIAVEASEAIVRERASIRAVGASRATRSRRRSTAWPR